MSQLRQRYPELVELGAEVLAISPDGPEDSRSLAERQDIPYPLLSDADLKVTDLWGVRHEGEPSGRLIPRPAAFVVDCRGVIRFAYVGENPSDRPSEDTLLDVLRGLGSGGADAGNG